MIERLMNQERPYEGPTYRKLSEKIIRLKQALYSQLSQQGKEQLEQLTDTYSEQITALLEDAFVDGFCTAFDLYLDYLGHSGAYRSIANQQQPPGF